MEPDGWTGRGRGGRGAIGVLAAAALCFCLAASTAVRLPVFFGADERPHFAYAADVVHGDLPTLDDRIPVADDDRFPIFERWADGLAATGGRARQTVFVANHPPLFYVIAAGPVWLASLTGSDALPPLVVRLLNAGFMALGVALTGLLAREVLSRSPHRDLLAAVAAGVVAVTPNLVGVAAYGQNDGLGFALGAGALLVAVRLLRRGPDRRLLAVATALAIACGLSRASLVPAVALMAAAAGIGAWRHRTVDGRRALGRALGVAGAIAATPVAAAGWFYLRNQDLYGTPTGDRHNLRLLGRVVDERSIVDVVTDWRFHHEMWTGLYGSVHPHLQFSGDALVAVGLLGLVVAGLVTWGRRSVAVGRDVTAAVLLAGYVLAVSVGVADHVGQGGSPHPRYLLPLVPLIAVAVAAAIAALPRWRSVAAVTIAALATISTSLLLRYGSLIDEREHDGQVALPGAPAPIALTGLGLALAAVAFALLLRTLASGGSAAGGEGPRPTAREEVAAAPDPAMT